MDTNLPRPRDLPMKAWTASLLALAAGCSLLTSSLEGKPVSEAYAGGQDLRVLDIESPLRARKRVPVLSTPEVLAVYVPTHMERDLMIGEHWLFLKLRDAEWWVERVQNPDPPASGEVPPEAMRPLKTLDWRKAVVPYRSTP